MAKPNPWIVLVKNQYRKVLSEKKFKGGTALREAIKRAKKIYAKNKKTVPGGPKEFAAGKSGRKIKSLGEGRGVGIGKGRGPIGVPIRRKRTSSFQDLT